MTAYDAEGDSSFGDTVALSGAAMLSAWALRCGAGIGLGMGNSGTASGSGSKSRMLDGDDKRYIGRWTRDKERGRVISLPLLWFDSCGTGSSMPRYWDKSKTARRWHDYEYYADGDEGKGRKGDERKYGEYEQRMSSWVAVACDQGLSVK